MGTKQRRERERQEMRDKILDAARDLFINEGYEAVTMRRIAARIEYSATAIYAHFADKESLMRQLCDRDFLAMAMSFRKIALIEDPVERLAKLGESYASFGLTHPNHYRLMFMTPNLPPKAEEHSAIERGNPQEDAYAFLRHTVQECIDAGRLRPELKDADLVAQTVWAGGHGVVSLLIAKKGDTWVDWRPAKKLLRVSIDALMRGILKDGGGKS